MTLKSKLARALAKPEVWPSWLDGQALYELGQTYRHAPMENPAAVNQAWTDLRCYVRDQVHAENARLRPILDILSECVEALEQTLPHFKPLDGTDYVTAHTLYNEASQALQRLAEKLGE